jgi:hypothetical protein
VRAPSLLLLLAVLGCLPASATAPSNDVPERILLKVRDLFPSAPFGRQETIEPHSFPQDDPGAPVISLARIDDPLGLERRLRELVRAPYANVRIRVANGRAQLGNFSVGSSESLEGDLLVIRGTADVYGDVTGNLVALDGDILIHRGATIDGDALALGGKVRNLGGTVLGESRSVSDGEAPAIAPRSELAATGMRLAGVVGVFLTLALVGFGLVLFGRPHLETVSDTASHSFLRSFLVGLLSQVLIVPTFGMLVVGLVLSVVGVLLVPFVVIVYALLVIVGIVGGLLAVAHALGETHTRRQMARGVALSPNSFRYLAFGLGALASVWLAWALCGWVPVASGLVLGAAVLSTWLLGTVGLGAAVLSRAGVQPQFAGRYLPAEMLTDEYLWATPQQGVPAVKRPGR